MKSKEKKNCVEKKTRMQLIKKLKKMKEEKKESQTKRGILLKKHIRAKHIAARLTHMSTELRKLTRDI